MKQLTNNKQLQQELINIIKTCNNMLEDNLNNYWEEEVTTSIVEEVISIKEKLNEISSNIIAEIPF